MAKKTYLEIDIDKVPAEQTVKYNVWELRKIAQHTKPGVYVFFDIDGEVLYIGESGTGNDKVGTRVINHIRGNTEQMSYLKNHYIREVCIYEFPDDITGKLDKDILEKWLIQMHRPLFNQCYGETIKETLDYFGKQNNHLCWNGWNQADKQKLIASGLL